jgi:hypothetical protein
MSGAQFKVDITPDRRIELAVRAPDEIGIMVVLGRGGALALALALIARCNELAASEALDTDVEAAVEAERAWPQDRPED